MGELRHNFHILNLGTIWRWMVSFFILGGTPPPPPPSKYPLNRRLRGHQSLCGRCRECTRLWTVLNRTMIPAKSSHLYTGAVPIQKYTRYICADVGFSILLSLKGKQSSMSVTVRHFQLLKTLKRFSWQWALTPLTANPSSYIPLFNFRSFKKWQTRTCETGATLAQLNFDTETAYANICLMYYVTTWLLCGGKS